MTGQAEINGKDIWTTWGASLCKGCYEVLLTPSSMKDYIQNESRLEHGVRIIANSQTAKTTARIIQLQFFIEGNTVEEYLSRYNSFLNEITNGVFTFKVYRLNATYKLVYTDCSKYGNYGEKRGKFTLKFIEPNTKDRT